MAKHSVATLISPLGAVNSWLPTAMSQSWLQRLLSRARTPHWIDEKRFSIKDVRFLATKDPAEYHTLKSVDDEFLLVKDKTMLERTLLLSRRRPFHRILDMGIWQGGSVAFYDLAFRPDKLVAIEYAAQSVASLDTYVAKHERASNVRLFYGVNQGDFDRMNAILAQEFAEERIDFIVDDASHQYEETRTAFNATFPYLAAGGYYVIEDWAWSHCGGWTLPYFKDRLALTNLILEIQILMSSRPDLISNVEVFPDMAVIVKGRGQVEPGKFDIGMFCTSRGQRFQAWL